jgi:hypothetical protein
MINFSSNFSPDFSASFLPHRPLRFPRPGVCHGLRRATHKAIQNGLLIAAIFLTLSFSRPASGQALPTAEASPISTGFELPRTAGTLQYSVSANESVSSGYYSSSGLSSSTGLTGDLAFISTSKTDPFSMVFSAGRSWSTSGQPSTLYSNLALSQVITTPMWSFVLSDSVSYMPETASTGLSGIPGTGDLGIPPVQVGDDFGQGVLTGYSTRVSNIAALSVQRRLTGATSLQLSGSYSILRFVGNSANNGIDNNSESGSIGLNHRLDARTNIGGNYAYSQFTYGSQPGFSSQTASIDYSRQLSRRLMMNLAAGPQWSNTGTGQNASTNVNLFAAASLNYSTNFANYSLGYSRGNNSGSGVVQGARSDSANISASRTFKRVWNGAVNVSYTDSTSISSGPTFSSDTTIGGAQLSRAIARSLSVYASYTLEHQTTSGAAAGVNAFSGTYQTASFGLTYSPTSIHFGPR